MCASDTVFIFLFPLEKKTIFKKKQANNNKSQMQSLFQ